MWVLLIYESYVNIDFRYINLIRLNGKVSAQKLKTIFSSLATTSHGVNALASYMLSELDEILALEEGHLFASFAYSTLASKIATDDEINIVISFTAVIYYGP